MSHMRVRVTLDVWLNVWVDTEPAARLHVETIARFRSAGSQGALEIDELNGMGEILEIEEVQE